MSITKHTVDEKPADYLRHDLTLMQLVDWAEQALMEGDSLRPIWTLSNGSWRGWERRPSAIGLTWADCK